MGGIEKDKKKKKDKTKEGARMLPGGNVRSFGLEIATEIEAVTPSYR
jgi:hypothetical protein